MELKIKKNGWIKWFAPLIYTLLASISCPAQVTNNKAQQPESSAKVIASKYFQYLFKAQDLDAMRKIIAKDAVYDQAEGLPYGGRYLGFDKWLEMFQKAQSLFDLRIEGEPVYYSSDSSADEVMICFTIVCTSKKTHKQITMPIAEYYKVKKGLVVEIRAFYFDTKAFVDFLS